MNTIDLTASNHPFLRGLNEMHLQLLSQFAYETHVAAGAVIFREGQPADRFYLIRDGKVALQSHAGGKPLGIGSLESGEVLGWSWMFAPYIWHFDARAEKDTDLIAIAADRLRQECEVDPGLGYQVMKRVSEVLIQRLQATRLKLVNASNPTEGSKLNQRT
jgi:CRP/FNR family cyclic AMP-dependent transcriptional regulator